ncbi:uracil-DNA glycosylase family protein [Methylomonas methanica]|uniref:Uracil-DNA glycosylase superfamily n=1 Tax=Methylomonas methanica (strain DSM 25384 / MC09) TaxID=857087 RepID=G0A1Z6_METMM|nr:uracil-DNA glycosylase family protein [Methylomonas methanica]AEG01379.1 Uracil-DNA glycosylase superfamily [Methylomonas methanica MC09]
MSTDFDSLIAEARGCTLCASQLPLAPKPIFQLHPAARILIAGQAPGIKAHTSGIPFDDASGQRLRNWLGLSTDRFYDPSLTAILPMEMCYPGRGHTGDLSPRPECAEQWRKALLKQLPNIKLTLVIGRYAQVWHLPGSRKLSLTDTVKLWRNYWPDTLPLPHPSPRNNRWLKQNPWFEQEILPVLRAEISSIARR